MSRIRKNTTAVTESKPMEYDSDPTDYKIQHPLAAFKHVPAQTDDDHLHQYTEIRPFEDAEWSFKGAGKAVKNAAGKVAKAGRAAAGKAGKVVGSLKYKKEVKKVEKLVGKIEAEEKKIYKLRKKQKDTEAFDKAVKAKLDPSEEETYDEALN